MGSIIRSLERSRGEIKDQGAKRRLEKVIRMFSSAEPTEGVGILKLAGVPLYEEEKELGWDGFAKKMKEEAEAYKNAENKEEFSPVLTPRATEDILVDFIDKFMAMPAKKQKMFIQLAKVIKK